MNYTKLPTRQEAEDTALATLKEIDLAVYSFIAICLFEEGLSDVRNS